MLVAALNKLSKAFQLTEKSVSGTSRANTFKAIRRLECLIALGVSNVLTESVSTYLCNFLSSAAEIYERNVDEVGAMTYGDSLFF